MQPSHQVRKVRWGSDPHELAQTTYLTLAVKPSAWADEFCVDYEIQSEWSDGEMCALSLLPYDFSTYEDEVDDGFIAVEEELERIYFRSTLVTVTGPTEGSN